MKYLKLYVVTLLGLEVLAIIVHFNELLDYFGSLAMALMPVFLIIGAILMLFKIMFK